MFKKLTIKEIMKIWQECYGEDMAVEYEGFINKLKEREHE